MNNDSIKDKAVFAVGLMAAFLAFSAYKDELSKIRIDLGSFSPSLSSLFITFIILISLSVYFYALDYIKFGIPTWQNSFIFKITSKAGSFFYNAAILFPLLIFVYWLLIPLAKVSPQTRSAVITFDYAAAALLALLAAVEVMVQAATKREQDIEQIEEEKTEYLGRALQLFNNSFFGETIIESFRVIESHLRERLLKERALHTDNMSNAVVVRLAEKMMIVGPKTVAQIHDVRVMRNNAAHSAGKEFTREQAQFAMDTVRNIIENPTQ